MGFLLVFIVSCGFGVWWMYYGADMYHKRKSAIEENTEDEDVVFCEEEEADSLEEMVAADDEQIEEEVVLTEKERKAEFDKQQAALRIPFLIQKIDNLYSDYNVIAETIEEVNQELKAAIGSKHLDKEKRLKSNLAMLNKRERTLSEQIYKAEEALRLAQFKAGTKIVY